MLFQFSTLVGLVVDMSSEHFLLNSYKKCMYSQNRPNSKVSVLSDSVNVVGDYQTYVV